MRIHHTVFLFLLMAGIACNRNNVSIQGTVEEGEGNSITLERLDVNRTTVIDSANIGNDGSFTIKTFLEEPELFILRYSKGEIINLLITPGENIHISSTDESFDRNYGVEGSEESENIRILVENLNKTRKTLDSLEAKAVSIGDPDTPQMDQVREAYYQAIINQKRFTISYLVGHMNSLSSVYALYQKYNDQSLVMGRQEDLQYFKTVADSLEQSHPNSSLTLSLRADISSREAEFKKNEQLNTLLEMADETTGFLDLSIPDRDGNEITLSDLEGKVTLVVFWSSGNQGSINSLLQLKSTYNLYHKKGFEVYAISLDNDKYQWMNAIDFNEFNWINVSELSFPESRAALLYNVNSIPSNFLINKEGDIAAKNLFGKTLETWLDNLL